MSSSAAFARAAYAGLLRLATPLYFARLWWRGRREPMYRKYWRERLGWANGLAEPGRLWIHAVSLGEARAAAALIEALRRKQPGLRLLLTHGTATGRQAGAALLRHGDAQAWLPYDTPGAVRRFLAHHQPCAGVLMETEIWPALLRAAQERGVPMVLANARLSQRSQRKGRRWAALLRPAVAGLAQVLAQSQPDAQRLIEAGARNVLVVGNLKFDMTPDAALLARGQAWRRALHRPLVLAASTRDTEEALLLDAWHALPGPRPLLVLVPRHPQRFDAVAALALSSGLSMQRRSSWSEMPPAAAAHADLWVGDSVGEMALYYGLADAALLGGSFAPLGGQNLIEAAACGCPVVMGPHTFNFAAAAEMAIRAGAAFRVANLGEGVSRAVLMALSPQRAAIAARALSFAGSHRGAADRMAAEVLRLLEPAPG